MRLCETYAEEREKRRNGVWGVGGGARQKMRPGGSYVRQMRSEVLCQT